MQDDLVTCLTRQVKEEVIDNYLRERRLIELQLEDLHTLAAQSRELAEQAGKSLKRLACLMITSDMRVRLCEILRLANSDFWSVCLNGGPAGGIEVIKVRAITCKGKFRKLLFESYARLRQGMEKYSSAYKDLAGERDAVNRNIVAFQKNFDLLSILCFLRNLDMQGLEKKKILGGNFTAAEIAELDKNLYVKPVSMDALDVPPPLDLPECSRVESRLSGLSEEIFRRHEKEVRSILK